MVTFFSKRSGEDLLALRMMDYVQFFLEKPFVDGLDLTLI